MAFSNVANSARDFPCCLETVLAAWEAATEVKELVLDPFPPDLRMDA
jgi:hypothetical protein